MDPFYGNAVDAVSYWSARNYASPANAADTDDIDSALLVASEWIDGTFRSSFSGLKVGLRPQIREWPRNDAFDIYAYPIDPGSVPVEVINATYEAAYRQIVSPGSLLKDYTPGKYASVAIDGAISVKYNNGLTAADVQTQYLIIDQILFPILTGTGAGAFSGLSGGASRC